MSTGLPTSDVINVQVTLDPTAAQERNFGNGLFVGDSDVIDTVERLRVYTTLGQVAADFGNQAPEYLASQLYFGQNPQPEECYIGRWASTAVHGVLRGAILSPTQKAVGNFNNINNGSLSVVIDSTPHNITGLDFTAQVNLNGIAQVLDSALTGFGNVSWDANNSRFLLESATAGSLSSVQFATLAGSGTDMSAAFGFSQAAGGYTVGGINAETILTALQLFANRSTDWYNAQVAANANPGTNDYLALASFIEGASPTRTLGITTQDPSSLDPSITTDLGSQLQALGVNRTFIQYSSNTPYAAASFFGRAATVDFEGDATTITMAFKQEPLVVAELLTESQKQALVGKNINAFLKYNNNTSILMPGIMCGGQWFDAVHGTDWLQNEMQTDVWNLFLTTNTKIPQTDDGMNSILTTLSGSCQKGVNNGLLFPGGQWNGPPITPILKTGDTLAKGYVAYAPPVNTQTPAQRGTRITPPIQIAVKLAGAFHGANILVSVDQ